MTLHRYFQLDVFSHRPGGGNPLGVVVGADDWSDAAMQAFAKWTDIVETTFLLRPTTNAASYRLRIFTPTREIAFAGHPSIGSAHVALLSGFASASEGVLIQECQAGLLPIRVEGESGQRRLFIHQTRQASAGLCRRRPALVAGRICRRIRATRLAARSRLDPQDRARQRQSRPLRVRPQQGAGT